MAFDLSALANYSDEHRNDLIRASILNGRTIDIIQVMGGVKNSATINVLSSPVTGQAGACGWNAAGTTTVSQRTVTVCPIKINSELCVDDLNTKYLSTSMNPGSYNESMPFEQLYAEETTEQINNMLESIVWQGDTTGSGNLALCDGFIKIIGADAVASANTVSNTGSLSALTVSNAIAIVDSMVAAIDADIIAADDLKLFMGYDTYRLYTQALRNTNSYNYGVADEGADFRLFVPGVNVEAIAVKGLNSTGDMYLSPASNLVAATDMLEDFEDFRIWYYEADDVVRTRAKFKIGVEMQFAEYVTSYIGA